MRSRTTRHHQRVTLIALKLAEAVNLNDKEKLTLFYAGLLHDFGVTSSKDKLNIMDYTGSQRHTETGWNLLSKNRYFKEVAEIIRYHHNRWLGPNKSGFLKDRIPLLSQILYLADRIEVLISDNEYILKQRERITDY